MSTKYAYSYGSTDVIVQKSVIEVKKTGDTPSSDCPLIIEGIKPPHQVDLCKKCCTNLTLVDTIDSQSTTNINAGPYAIPSVSSEYYMYIYKANHVTANWFLIVHIKSANHNAF